MDMEEVTSISNVNIPVALFTDIPVELIQF